MPYLIFCDWHIPLSMMSLRFIHVQHVWEFSSFLMLINFPLYIHTHLLIPLSINGLLLPFWLMNNATMNMSLHISLQEPAFTSFGHISRIGIAGSYDNSIFNFLRYKHMFFIAAAPFYIPTNSAQGLQFLHVLVNSCYFLAFLMVPP